MRPSRHSLLAISVALLASAAPAAAQTQGNQQQQNVFDLKPFVPPILLLPPNATQVQPGVSSQLPGVGEAPSSLNNPQTAPPSGLRITIPNR